MPLLLLELGSYLNQFSPSAILVSQPHPLVLYFMTSTSKAVLSLIHIYKELCVGGLKQESVFNRPYKPYCFILSSYRTAKYFITTKCSISGGYTTPLALSIVPSRLIA